MADEVALTDQHDRQRGGDEGHDGADEQDLVQAVDEAAARGAGGQPAQLRRYRVQGLGHAAVADRISQHMRAAGQRAVAEARNSRLYTLRW